MCCFVSCKKELDMTLVQKTVYENTDISLFHIDDAWDVTFVYDSLKSYVELEYSAYLEEGKGYSEAKVVEFLKAWTPEAVKTLR